MAKGGKTNEQMKKLGRNLAKIANQKSGKKPVKDMGKVMGLVKTRAAGRADMGAVSALIKSKLGTS